jgi:hypothetical protein
LPQAIRFDPYPFQFLTFVVSLEAIFLSTFILISQNRQNRISELRNHLDLQINLLSEQENSKVLAMLEALLRFHGLASITISATFGHPAWWKGSPNPQFFRYLGASTWDIVRWGGRRHDQGPWFGAARSRDYLIGGGDPARHADSAN